jgi:hypothetical protein
LGIKWVAVIKIADDQEFRRWKLQLYEFESFEEVARALAGTETPDEAERGKMWIECRFLPGMKSENIDALAATGP